jgi:hypothetical protein
MVDKTGPMEPIASDITEAIRLIGRQVATTGAKFAIVDEGCPDESSLMATRDGFLNMALAVLRLVALADEGRARGDSGPFDWDDEIKAVMHQLPSWRSVWLVGACLFPDHASLIAEIQRMVGPDIAASLTADPAFKDPAR